MGIKANFSMGDVKRKLESDIKKIEDAALSALVKLGTECAEYARTHNGFDDETGNLRSSIGFKVFRDGRAVHENYVQVLEGQEGVSKGRALADAVGKRCGEHQMMLVVTAGMEYAIYLEANGHDVLASSEMFARSEWPKMRQRIEEASGW